MYLVSPLRSPKNSLPRRVSCLMKLEKGEETVSLAIGWWSEELELENVKLVLLRITAAWPAKMIRSEI